MYGIAWFKHVGRAAGAPGDSMDRSSQEMQRLLPQLATYLSDIDIGSRQRCLQMDAAFSSKVGEL